VSLEKHVRPKVGGGGLIITDEWRRFYAEEVRIAANVRSPALIEAFARVPRENFMGPPPWKVASPEMAGMALMGLKGEAYVTTENVRDLYHNVLVAIDAARYLNNGQPSALARWIDVLELKPGDSVYHLGCGVGYYTAIMAEVVGSSGRVAASEVDPTLADRARENLAAYPNVSVYTGDGATFDPGTCDAMLINAGVTHPNPLWLERLGERGRIVLPLTSAMGTANAGTGVVAKVTRRGNGFAAQVATLVGIYSCTSLRDPELNAALAKAMATRALLNLRSIRTDPHEQAETCLAHTAGMCLSSAEPAGHAESTSRLASLSG
jgi:protein-L-isoaspartate(D-aspartate) O-methyltransferase